MNKNVIYLLQFGKSSRSESCLFQVLDKNNSMGGKKMFLILNDMPEEIFNRIFHHFFDILSGLFNKQAQKSMQLY